LHALCGFGNDLPVIPAGACPIMKKTFVLLFAASVSLAACSQRAQDESAQAVDTTAADANATMRTAANSTEAAADKAFGSAEATLDNAGDAIGNAADKAKDKTGQALKDAGNTVDE
jgi:hypothetical protein